MDNDEKLRIINRLVGNVTPAGLEKMLKNIEVYITSNIGIFIPSLDYCDYAISPQHTHPAYSFIYNFSGPATVKVKDTVKQSPFHNNANICAFYPEVPHEEIVEDQFKSYFAVCIEKDFYEKQLACYPNINPKVLAGDYFPADEEILYALKRFMIEHEKMMPGREEVLNALALEITHLLIRHCNKISSENNKISQKIEINQLICFLNENFAKKITVEEMASKVNFSPSHFTRIFKEETGFSPIEFLINLRIQKAKKSLRSKGSNITEVALSCGFSSSAYFTACFKERMGRNPSEFLKSN